MAVPRRQSRMRRGGWETLLLKSPFVRPAYYGNAFIGLLCFKAHGSEIQASARPDSHHLGSLSIRSIHDVMCGAWKGRETVRYVEVRAPDPRAIWGNGLILWGSMFGRSHRRLLIVSGPPRDPTDEFSMGFYVTPMSIQEDASGCVGSKDLPYNPAWSQPYEGGLSGVRCGQNARLGM